MIRTVGICHTDLTVLYFTYIGIIDLDHLVLCKKVCAVFLAIYRDTDRTIMSTPGKVHATPENQSKHHDTDDKSQFFFLQIKLPHFYKRGNFSINNTNIIIAYDRLIDKKKLEEANNGNLLKTVYANGDEIRYSYDSQNRITASYLKNATASEKKLNTEAFLIYDSGANLLAVNIDGKYYTYVRNIQNDIIALVDASGKTVVNYAYDSWGKLLHRLH